ncbi:MAG: hypothetical protein P8Z71_03865, partial [Candidatus Sulfobium sp.]
SGVAKQRIFSPQTELSFKLSLKVDTIYPLWPYLPQGPEKRILIFPPGRNIMKSRRGKKDGNR